MLRRGSAGDVNVDWGTERREHKEEEDEKKKRGKEEKKKRKKKKKKKKKRRRAVNRNRANGASAVCRFAELLSCAI